MGTDSGGCTCDGTVKSEFRSINTIRRYKVPKWFTEYLTAIGETLAVTPLPLDDPLLLMQAVNGAANCPYCRLEIHNPFRCFFQKRCGQKSIWQSPRCVSMSFTRVLSSMRGSLN
jgi:hypothetical protein